MLLWCLVLFYVFLCLHMVGFIWENIYLWLRWVWFPGAQTACAIYGRVVERFVG